MSVSPSFDRQRRQREADHAGRGERRRAMLGDLIADHDFYRIERGIGSLIPTAPALPIPKAEMPRRVASHVMAVDAVLSPDPIAEMMSKLNAEAERMRRLLPVAPRGMTWEAELQAKEPVYDFAAMHADIEMRLVWRLVEMPGFVVDYE